MFATIAKLLARRILVSIPILLLVSMLLFMILRVLPVDPAAMSLPPNATIEEIEAKRVEMGLTLPLPQQYAIWLSQVAHGDFGTSIQLRTSVTRLIGQTLPATIELAVLAMAIASALGIAGGLLLFYLRGTRSETVLDVGSIALLSLPEFLWGLFLILLFGVWFEFLPFTGVLSAGYQKPDITGFLLVDSLITGQFATFWNAVQHLILPAFALGVSFSPPIMRVLRSSLLDVYQDDYIHQARLRGLSERRILIGHALKNAILPTLSLMGVQFGFLFGGTLLIEIIYSYPGMGNLMVDAIRNTDLPIIQAVGLTYCVVVLVISILVDSLYLILNPKLRTR
ncbi:MULTISPECIES: ABC transporter permease [Phyllobacteriaceae]|jgi:peptide/nickel transport system permease protein|uniref:ABC transporter permease n=1 Tax=Ollibium composti TaxID=2675109 RepID=A0ABY2Q642_9HYPH|nr:MULTISPECIES: ABC transporter permease [Mesorhizobium]QDC01605.1 ABC transporter permease [Mesorhizobium sp. 8]THF56984.1 ABC transporter permease [Mesorhizobium composti]